MNIPAIQFYIYFVDDETWVYQNYEAALNRACERAKSSEFIDLDPDNEYEIKLLFPKTKRKITIIRKLFTYDSKIPLAVPDYSRHEKTYDYKNLGI